MKIEITNKVELANPQLEITINLETGEAIIRLKYRCPDCAGYGCRAETCIGGTISKRIQPQDLVRTLGPEFKNVLNNLQRQIVTEIA